MKPTDRMIRDELQREVADLPIPTDMWQRINERLDNLPHVAPAVPPKQHWLVQWRAALAVAAAGLFWLTVVPASRLADQHPARPIVAANQVALATDAADVAGPNRTVSIPFVPHPRGDAVAAPPGRVPTPQQ